MCHKIDSTNLTRKSSLLKDWWSICLSYFFSCFNSWMATSVYRGHFPAICRLCFSIFHVEMLTLTIPLFLSTNPQVSDPSRSLFPANGSSTYLPLPHTFCEHIHTIIVLSFVSFIKSFDIGPFRLTV